jgi:hypothetical protein
VAISYVMPSIAVIVLYKRIIDKLKELSKNLNKDKKFEPKQNTASYLASLKKIRASNKITSLTTIASVLKTKVVSSVLGTSSALGNSSVNGTTTAIGGPTTLGVSTIENTINTQTTTQPDHNNNHRIQIRENKNPKQKRFAQQMVIINLLTCLGSIFSVLTNVQVTLSTNPYFASLGTTLENVSPMFRFIFLAIQSGIPIISIMYSPWSYSWKDFKNKIIKTGSDVGKSIKEKISSHRYK